MKVPDDESGCGTSKAPGCIKSIVGNSVLLKAYNDGIPANGKPVPDGAAFAKIEWQKARDSHSPYGVFVPGPLAEVAFMLKDSRRRMSWLPYGRQSERLGLYALRETLKVQERFAGRCLKRIAH